MVVVSGRAGRKASWLERRVHADFEISFGDEIRCWRAGFDTLSWCGELNAERTCGSIVLPDSAGQVVCAAGAVRNSSVGLDSEVFVTVSAEVATSFDYEKTESVRIITAYFLTGDALLLTG
jgi:hypothetical protein